MITTVIVLFIVLVLSFILNCYLIISLLDLNKDLEFFKEKIEVKKCEK